MRVNPLDRVGLLYKRQCRVVWLKYCRLADENCQPPAGEHSTVLARLRKMMYMQLYIA
jgi:hypothetical protein